MCDESRYWLRQFFFLFLTASAILLTEAVSAILLWIVTASSVLLVFGLDAGVGALREAVLARRLRRWGTADVDADADRGWLSLIGIGYVLVGGVALILGAAGLWLDRRSEPTLLGVALAALSMLLVPIVGSYMKAVAMELKSPALRAASVFTFGNSYLSMVLLVSLLVRVGMQRWWGDPLGALVMTPFILQKGLQILTDRGGPDATGSVIEP